MKLIPRTGMLLLVILVALQTSCVTSVVGAAVDTTVAVVKVPLKVGAVAVDAVSPDNEEDD